MIKTKPILIFLILFFLLLRLALLFTCIDQVYDLTNSEEVQRGAIAHDLIHGLKMPFFQYRADDYSGGSLVVGILTVPFFLLFGENIISLKLTGLAFFLLALIFLYLLANKFFNQRIAIICSFLFILPPTRIFITYSVTTMGFHSESILFSLILIFLFYEIFYAQKRNYLYFWLMGLVGGFGLWFTYVFAITLITCLLFWFSFDRKFVLRKYFYVFLFGFFIGFSPWLWFNFTYQFRGLEVFQWLLNFALGARRYIHYPIKTFTASIIMFFDLEAGKADAVHWLNLLYLLIYLVCFSYLFQVYRYSLFRFILNITPLVKPKPFTLKEAKYSFFLVYIVIFSFIYFLTNTGLTKRYLLPLFPAVFLIISFFIDIFWKKKVKKISVGLIIVVVLFLVGALNQVKFFLNCDNFAKGLKYKGYSYLYKIQSCP